MTARTCDASGADRADSTLPTAGGCIITGAVLVLSVACVACFGFAAGLAAPVVLPALGRLDTLGTVLRAIVALVVAGFLYATYPREER